MKKVSSVLQRTSGRNKSKSAKLIKRPVKYVRKDKSWHELSNYCESRNQDTPLIATANSDATKIVDVPYLEISSLDLDKNDFSDGFARILLEPKSCIFFQTDNLSKDGLDRLTLILRDVLLLFDGRLTLFIQKHDDTPFSLAKYVEKEFDVPNRALVPSKRSTTDKDDLDNKKLRTDTDEHHNRILDDREKEIAELKRNLTITSEGLKKEEFNCEEFRRINTLKEDLLKSKERKLETALSDNENLRRQKAAEDDLKRTELDRVVQENKSLHFESENLRIKFEELKNAKVELEQKFNKSEEENIRLHGVIKEKDLEIEKLASKAVGSVDSVASKAVSSVDLDASKASSDTNVVARKDVEEIDSGKAVARIEGLKSKLEKFSENKKLSPREIVFRSIRHFDVNEIFEITAETEFKCQIQVKVDSSNLLIDKVFTAVAPTKNKCLMTAYSQIISFLKSC